MTRIFKAMKISNGALTAILATAVLAGCNGANNGGSLPPGTGTNCGGPPSVNQLEVVFPAPGSKKAPQTLGNIYVATKGQLPPSNQFNFYLVQSNGASTYTSTFFGISESKIPPPHKTPTYSNPVYYASSLPPSYTIGPDQAVSLIWNDGGTGCNPHVLVSSFRTADTSSNR
jgi:hypothetical protein